MLRHYASSCTIYRPLRTITLSALDLKKITQFRFPVVNLLSNRVKVLKSTQVDEGKWGVFIMNRIALFIFHI